jgi:hypothetical protein
MYLLGHRRRQNAVLDRWPVGRILWLKRLRFIEKMRQTGAAAHGSDQLAATT